MFFNCLYWQHLLSVVDEDGDFVKCRWATRSSGINECGDVCYGLSNATLIEVYFSL